MLHLDKNTGEIVVANKIDHEVYDWLNLTVIFYLSKIILILLQKHLLKG